MKLSTVLLVFLGLSVYSCTNGREEIKDQPEKEKNVWGLDEFSEAKQDALDALDKIQISGWQLYSTFPNNEHECEGNVGSFKMSQKQFEDALLHLLLHYYPNMDEKEKLELASKASKGQNNYEVKTCGVSAEELEFDDAGHPPRNGVWIFQALMNQRDLIIRW